MSKFVTRNPDYMLSSLITSQTRIKLLKKFFLNSSIRAHLRGLESEFEESSNAIRIELNRFEEAGLLNSQMEGNKKIFRANKGHPLYNDIHSIILKETEIDKVIDKVISRLGNIRCVYLTGDISRGKDSRVIELILVGSNIDQDYLERKIYQAQLVIGRKITYTLLTTRAAKKILLNFKATDLLPLWNSNGVDLTT